MNLNDLYETRDSRDAYQRDVDNSRVGMTRRSRADVTGEQEPSGIFTVVINGRPWKTGTSNEMFGIAERVANKYPDKKVAVKWPTGELNVVKPQGVSEAVPPTQQKPLMAVALDKWKQAVLNRYPEARFATQKMINGATIASDMTGQVGIYDPKNSYAKVGPETQQGVAEGINESDDYSAVTSAITRRIITQHPEVLAKYGPAVVGQAIDEIAEFVGDVDEIGSSDVSGWVSQVIRSLGRFAPVRDEGVDEGSLNEFLDPQAVAQDPGLEREPTADVIFFGRMPQDFTANLVEEALEAVLPNEYPPGKAHTNNSNVFRVVSEIAKRQGAVVTTKPLSVAQKLAKTFQTYGIKCKVDPKPGLEEDIPAQDSGEYDYEGDQAKDQLNTIVRAAQRLNGLLDDNENMPEWVQMKITNAADYIDTAADYIESNQEPELDEGDRVGNMDADKFDDALARMKKLAGAGPLKTVWDPEKRVYRNVPVAVQPKK